MKNLVTLNLPLDYEDSEAKTYRKKAIKGMMIFMGGAELSRQELAFRLNIHPSIASDFINDLKELKVIRISGWFDGKTALYSWGNEPDAEKQYKCSPEQLRLAKQKYLKIKERKAASENLATEVFETKAERDQSLQSVMSGILKNANIVSVLTKISEDKKDIFNLS